MKKPTTPRHRATWLLLAAPALLATPAIAQDAPVAPPPVIQTVPQTAAPAPAPVTTQAPPTAAGESKTVIRPEALEVVDEARQRPAARPAASQPARRVTTTTTTRTTAPAVAAPAPAPVAAAPEPVTPPPAAVPEAVAPPPVAPPPVAEPAAPEATTDTALSTQTTETQSTPVWPWIALGAVLILAGLGLFALRRKRANEAFADQYGTADAYYTEATPAYVEPEPVAHRETVPVAAAAAPVAAVVASDEPEAELLPAAEIEPVSAEDVSVGDAEAAEVAALTDAAPTVSDRPWLEFAMRPVRAGTNSDEAMVEIELTVANAGGLPAEDVRVSTFMLTEANASEMERLLVDPPADSAVDPVTIQPGEGARIDATLAALKADLGGSGVGFTPVVVADARYRLPDGSEGRTSASFLVGVADESGNLAPFALDDREMHDDVEARLHGEPQRV